MNLNFMNLLLEKCCFPDDAKYFFSTLADKLIADGYEAEFDNIVRSYQNCGFSSEDTDGSVIDFAKKAGGSHYSYWMLLLIFASEQAKKRYDARGVSDEIFWDTFSDLRYKALECMEEHGVWGTFVAGWYNLFMKGILIKFGRLEYQDADFNMDTPYVLGDVTVEKGTPIKSIHIPSSGEPFDREARLESYRMAYEFYKKESGCDKLICDCGSWLLFPDYENVFAPGSNVSDFRHEFDIIRRHEHSPSANEHFGDDWRVFGKDHRKSAKELPEDTSMRRAFKKHLLSGGKVGDGIGMLIFDGEKILTKNIK